MISLHPSWPGDLGPIRCGFGVAGAKQAVGLRPRLMVRPLQTGASARSMWSLTNGGGRTWGCEVWQSCALCRPMQWSILARTASETNYMFPRLPVLEDPHVPDVFEGKIKNCNRFNLTGCQRGYGCAFRDLPQARSSAVPQAKSMMPSEERTTAGYLAEGLFIGVGQGSGASQLGRGSGASRPLALFAGWNHNSKVRHKPG